MTSQEHGEIGRLKREVADLKRRVRFCGRRQLFSLQNLTVHAEMVSHVQACWDRFGVESTYRVLGATAETPARPRN